MKRILSCVSPSKEMREIQQDTEIRWTHDGQEYAVRIPAGYQYRPGLKPNVGLLTFLRLIGPSYALEDVSAAHDRLFTLREQHPDLDISRAAADAVMKADEDDPYWLRMTAWAFLRATSWIVW